MRPPEKAQVGSRVKEPYVGVCKGFCGNLLHEKKNLGANLSVQMDSSYAYESICTLKLAPRFSFRAASSHKIMKNPSCEQGSQIRLEQHFGAISQRTPHNLGTPHIAPRKVNIDALPDVRAGSNPPLRHQAAEEGRRKVPMPYRRCVSVSFFHRHAFWFGLLEGKHAKINMIIAVNWGCKVYGGSGACFSA